MSRTDIRRRAGAVALTLLTAACNREQPRTVVLDPTTGREVATAPSPPTPPMPTPRVEPIPMTPAPVPVPVPEAVPQQQSAVDGAVLLAARRPMVPVEGVAPQALLDNYEQGRGTRKHEAIDIMAPRGTRVFAVDDGKLVKLFRSVPGGLTAYQFDSQGELAYYYAHLDRYAEGLKEGAALKRGDLIGFVGSTGNALAEAPHLHFAVFRLGPEKQWWKGDPVNPYPALRNGGGPAQASR